MAIKKLPEQSVLRKLLDYDPETGALTWKPRPVEMFRDSHRTADCWMKRWNTRHAGKPALSKETSHGYAAGSIFAVRYMRSRVIWKWMTDTDPDKIDHINGDRADDRFANLRSVSTRENNRNRGLSINNTSGCVGVYERRGRWTAVMVINLGTFATKAEAIAARKSAEVEVGYDPRHGVRPSRMRALTAPTPRY